MASGEHIVSGPEASNGSRNSSLTCPKPTYRSWRKKFKKMKHVFDEKMRVSDELFHDEQRAHETARRLAEQNDLLLDLLLDVNDSIHIPPPHQFNLSSPLPSPPSSPMLNGHASKKVNDLKPLSLLLSTVSHTHQAQPSSPSPSAPQPPLTYFTPIQEEDYLHTLDTALLRQPTGENINHPLHEHHNHPRRTMLIPTYEQEEQRERKHRDEAIKNPVSVYNWLKRWQPHVFLQESEIGGEKGSSKAKAKKPTASVARKTDHDRGYEDAERIEDERAAARTPLMTERGRGSGGGGSMKMKRKLDRPGEDEDSGYRPKGGSGSGSAARSASKRKRESEGGDGKKKAKRIDGIGERPVRGRHDGLTRVD